MRDLTEKTLAVRRVFDGRALTVDVLDIELPGGRKSVREVIRHRGAAVILGRRPDGRFVLIRQYRKAVEEALLEFVAGCLEPSETPEQGARREMEEETGYVPRRLVKLGMIVSSPGYSEEHLFLYLGELDAAPRAPRPDFDENLEVLEMTAGEIDGAIASGELHDAKSICAWYHYKRLFPEAR